MWLWVVVEIAPVVLPLRPTGRAAQIGTDRWIFLTPFDTNWKKGSGATPLTTQDLFFGDAISIPTAPTKVPLLTRRLFGSMVRPIAAFPLPICLEKFTASTLIPSMGSKRLMRAF
jgi:hypothetical protein